MKILDCGSNQKSLFAVVNNIRQKGEKQVLPESTSDETLANDFTRFFKAKIEKIVEKFSIDHCPCAADTTTIKSTDTIFTDFKTVSTKDFKRYISQSANKYYPQVVPLPMEFIKANIDPILGPILTTVVNNSITSGIVPQA